MTAGNSKEVKARQSQLNGFFIMLLVSILGNLEEFLGGCSTDAAWILDSFLS